MENLERVTDFIFLGSKMTADGDWSQEIKRHFLLGRKAMTNLDSVLKNRDYFGWLEFRRVLFRSDLLAVQGTLKCLLQHHSSKASILRHLAFFIVQFLHPYTTTGKTIALTRRTFVGKVMSLLFNMLSKLVITFLPRGSETLKKKLHIRVKEYFMSLPHQYW